MSETGKNASQDGVPFKIFKTYQSYANIPPDDEVKVPGWGIRAIRIDLLELL